MLTEREDKRIKKIEKAKALEAKRVAEQQRIMEEKIAHDKAKALAEKQLTKLKMQAEKLEQTRLKKLIATHKEELMRCATEDANWKYNQSKHSKMTFKFSDPKISTSKKSAVISYDIFHNKNKLTTDFAVCVIQDV